MSRKPRQPWQLPDIAVEDVYAVQAIAAGRAGQAEQLRFWAFLQRFTGTGRMTFYPGGEDGRRATDFAEGMRFVGDQMRRLNNLKPAVADSRGPPPAMPGESQDE